jgi:hypothetical protein
VALSRVAPSGLPGIPSAAAAVSIGYQYPLEVGAGAVKDAHVPDAVHQGAAGAFRKCDEQGIPGIPVAAWRLYLDELVIEQGAGRLFDDRIRETLFAEADDGAQRVCQAAQIAALFL